MNADENPYRPPATVESMKKDRAGAIKQPSCSRAAIAATAAFLMAVFLVPPVMVPWRLMSRFEYFVVVSPLIPSAIAVWISARLIASLQFKNVLVALLSLAGVVIVCRVVFDVILHDIGRGNRWW